MKKSLVTNLPEHYEMNSSFSRPGVSMNWILSYDYFGGSAETFWAMHLFAV